MFWVVATILVIGSIAYVSRPLWTANAGGVQKASGPSADIAVYKRQLAELDRDVEAGLVPESEAAASAREISRRLLAADKAASAAESQTSDLSSNHRKIFLGSICLFVPVVALFLYFSNGVPGYGDVPHANRCPDAEEQAIDGSDINRVVDCLAVRMDENPKPEGLAMLGRSYNTMGRHTEAYQAYAQALEMAGPSVENLEGLGLAVMFANQGYITDVAIEAFRQALQLDPKSPLSRYYMAEFDYQNGDDLKALRSWVDLLEETPPDTSMYDIVNQRIGRGLEQAQSQAGDVSASAGVNFENEGQATMIRSMVDGLAARLGEDPNDLAGWLKLIRSYSVLNEGDKARSAISTATLTFLADPEALNKIVALSEELGLTTTSDLQIPMPE